MKEDMLSRGQWGALLWVAALAPAAELLPGTALETAGRGGWLSQPEVLQCCLTTRD